MNVFLHEIVSERFYPDKIYRKFYSQNMFCIQCISTQLILMIRTVQVQYQQTG